MRLPNGRQVCMVDQGRHEVDTGAWVSCFGYPYYLWYPSKRMLTEYECNERIDGLYLHEWVTDKYDETTDEEWE